MLNDILYVATIFLTRIALPILVTFVTGMLIERVLRRDTSGTPA